MCEVILDQGKSILQIVIEQLKTIPGKILVTEVCMATYLPEDGKTIIVTGDYSHLSEEEMRRIFHERKNTGECLTL